MSGPWIELPSCPFSPDMDTGRSARLHETSQIPNTVRYSDGFYETYSGIEDPFPLAKVMNECCNPYPSKGTGKRYGQTRGKTRNGPGWQKRNERKGDERKRNERLRRNEQGE